MPAWIHDRARHILAKNPSMPKGEAFAIATQQSHATGKSPKGYGTAEGKAVAEEKYDKPGGYKKTPNPGNLKTSKLPARTKKAHMNPNQLSAFGRELNSILKEAAGIPLSVLGNPKFAPFFDRVAAGGAAAPRLFKGGPPVNIPGVSPVAKAVGNAAQKVVQQGAKTAGLRDFLMQEIPGTKPWILGNAQKVTQSMGGAMGKVGPRFSPVTAGAGAALRKAAPAAASAVAPVGKRVAKSLQGGPAKAWDVSRQAAEMGL